MNYSMTRVQMFALAVIAVAIVEIAIEAPIVRVCSTRWLSTFVLLFAGAEAFRLLVVALDDVSER